MLAGELKVAVQNFDPVLFWVEDLELILPVLVANRDIEIGERLGFDYGEFFWLGRWKFPHLFNRKDNAIIPRDLYNSKQFFFKINFNRHVYKGNQYKPFFTIIDWEFFIKSFSGEMDSVLIVGDYIVLLKTDVIQHIKSQQGQKMLEIETLIARSADYERLYERLNLLIRDLIHLNNSGTASKTTSDSTHVNNLWTKEPSAKIKLNFPLTEKVMLSINQKLKAANLSEYFGFAKIESKEQQETQYSLVIPNVNALTLATCWDEIVNPTPLLTCFKVNKGLILGASLALGAVALNTLASRFSQ